MKIVHGAEPSERALRTAHAEVVSGILRAPLAYLEEDLQKSCENSEVSAHTYAQQMQERVDDLLPGDRKDTPAASHLNSVLVALSSLEKNRVRATRSTS